ncbi:MAG: phenylacetate--CoA ligase [Thermoleophilia bacterium]
MTAPDHVSYMSRDEMTALQNERLVRIVAYAYANVPFYRQTFDKAGVHPQDVRSLEDLRRLPFTYKTDIQSRFPYGLCAVEHRQIARVHSSSGSTGNPINTCYTAKDMDDWAVCMARGLATAGVTPDDVCQIAFRYTLFTGAFGHHLGAERLGATVIPTSSGFTERQIVMMQAFGTTVLHCTPSYALVIAEKAAELGLDSRSLPLRLGVHGAEPMSDGLRNELQERLGYRIARDYGLTELGGPGVSIECPAQDGYHINEDYFYPEIVDPATGAPLPDGEIGELVFTTLAKEGSPVLRYRTRDLTSLKRETCACGRTLVRHGLILGRTDDMLIVGGVNFFPSQVETVLLDFEELAPHYLIRLRSEERRDVVCVDVEPQPEWWATCADGGSDLCALVERRLRERIGFRMAVRLTEPFSLERSEGKTRRVVDER